MLQLIMVRSEKVLSCPEDKKESSIRSVEEAIIDFLRGLDERVKEDAVKVVPMSERQPPRLSHGSEHFGRW